MVRLGPPPAWLTGCEELSAMRRSRCAAGHKAMWHADFGGYPADEFLARLHPRLPALKASLGRETFTTDTPFGTLSREWAARLGLPRETVVAVGAFDAHVGAVLALDWMNGRRTPDANQRLKGAIAGISLGTDAPRIYRALVEATACGSRAIVERFRAEGIRIDGAIAIAGVARKSPFVMQTVANVMNMEIEVPAGDQAVALGAAMFAATASGGHGSMDEAQRVMSSGTETVYRPDPEQAKRYDSLYAQYLRLGAFGR